MRRLLTGFLISSVALAAPSREEVEFFEKSVRPVLAEHCHKCHGPEKQKGDLRLDSREAILKGSDTGPVVVPGDPAKSTLIRSIRHETENKMPEKAPKLSDEKIAALSQWVKMGLPWPPDDKNAPRSASEIARTHWSFQPVRKPAVPSVKDAGRWVQDDIDRFVLSKLEAGGFAPSPIASRYTLIRRATFDLTGLPPTADAVADFEKDPAPVRAAFAKVVDRLLASPAYGERWGRHWLDVARYADHRGYLAGGESREYPFAWTYRDWVIRSLNDDLPYDQFLTRQLAADIPGSGAKPQDIAALGFLTLGRRFLNNTGDIIDDRLDVVIRGTMSLTVGCARCHDHKFDPVTAKDYYALAGVFASCDEDADPGKLPLLPGGTPDDDYRKQRAQHLAELRAVDAKLAQDLSSTVFVATGVSIPYPPEVVDALLRHRYFKQKAIDERRKVEAKLVADELLPGAPPRAHVLRDKPVPINPRVFIRGNPARPGEPVPRRFFAFLGGEAAPFRQGSGRLELAKAITARENPLTARVIANRVWLHHFGTGLVNTPGDFGTRSEPPLHADLLDWLASSLMENGWSLKKFHRSVLLSSTWMQDTVRPEKIAGNDPQTADLENRLLWRQNRQRLEWEPLHDALLAAAGSLDAAIGGRPVKLFEQPFPTRRAIYGYIDRQNLPGTLRTFDFASPDLTNPQRSVTNVPQQALYLMNSPFVIAQAQKLAGTPDAATSDAERRIQSLYHRIFSRAATAQEIAAGMEFLRTAETAARLPDGPPLWQYGSGNYDPETKRVKFTRLPHWTGTAWQGGPKLPDPRLGWVSLNAGGGHPARDLAAIRRFTAPRDMTLSIHAPVGRPAKEGNGVLARIVSSRQGQLAEATAAPGTTVPMNAARIEIKAGETLDFILESRGDENSDAFEWHPLLKAADNAEYNARTQFSGPIQPPSPLSPWEKYAQVLLETNEFVFVD